MTEDKPRRGPGRPRRAPEHTQVSPKQPASEMVTIRLGWRDAWTSRGRIKGKETVTLRSDEAQKIVEKGLAQYE
jgi:hypothetical protein